MSATIKGITTAKGFHGKVPFAEQSDNAKNADKATEATTADKAKSLTSLSQFEGTTTENRVLSCCEISQTGIYIGVADISGDGNYSGFYSGVIVVTDLTKNGMGSIAVGELLYETADKSIIYSRYGNTTINSFIVYRIGDI